MAAVFAVQIFAIVFCFSGQAAATTIAVQPAMASACPMGMDAPAHKPVQEKLLCASCNLPDTGALANGIGSLSVDLPLVAILPDMWCTTSIRPTRHNFSIARAQAPPHSASLIYQTTLRIRL